MSRLGVRFSPPAPNTKVDGPDGKGMDCKSIALQSNVFESHIDLQNNKYYMKIFEVVAKLTKDVDPETGDSTVGANVTDFKNEYNRVVVMPMNQIRSRFEGDGKGDTKDVDARANINSIKKQIKRDISKIPPILVRRIPRENTYQVIDGHHRYFAFREMNVKRIPVIIMSAGQFTGDKYKK